MRTALGLLAAALVWAPTFAHCEPVKLKFAVFSPDAERLYNTVKKPFAAAVNASAGGTIEIELYPNGALGRAPQQQAQMVIDGVADIGFILTPAAAGKLKQQDVASLPFETVNSVEAAEALWKVYEKGVTAGEFNQVKLLGIWTFPNAALHSKEPIKTLDDVKGKKLVASNLIAAKIATALGATPVTFRPDEAYQAISRGITDGGLMPFTGMEVFKIHEVAKYHLDAALGSDSAILFMNKDRYGSLPPKAKEAIDKNSYLLLSRRLGEKTTAEWERTRGVVMDTVSTLSPEQEAQWRKALEPIAKEWAQTTPDGAKVLEAFRAEVAAARKK
jgi:TRAP-type C4-dicarboxylate transport system substrate-binding protein